MLDELLRQNGYETVPAYSGTEALLLFMPAPARNPAALSGSSNARVQNDFALILMDLMLPGKDGAQVLTEIRAVSSVPVIILTAVSDKERTVQLLQSGADDYIEKPFDNRELLARIDARLRRAVPNAGQPPAKLQYREITLDMESYEAAVDGQKVGLSKREFEILKLMMLRPQKVFSKNNLYESIWGGEFLGDDNTVNVHISKLRAKLNAAAPGREYVQTVWGIGFKMAEPPI
jgi:DNA-binding response OmpR family regulator